MTTSAIRLRIGAHSSGPGPGGSAQDTWLVSAPTDVSGSDHVTLPATPPADSGRLCVLADGIGGPGLGSLASSAWALSAAAVQREHPAVRACLADWIRAADRDMRAHLASRGAAPLGASLSLLWFGLTDICWLNVGATSIRRVRDGQAADVAPAQTRGEAAVRAGQPVPAQPHAPTQALCVGQRGSTEALPLVLEAGRDHGRTELHVGDRYVLSNGGVAQLPLRTLERIVAGAADPQAAAELLVQQCRAQFASKDATCITIYLEPSIERSVTCPR